MIEMTNLTELSNIIGLLNNNALHIEVDDVDTFCSYWHALCDDYIIKGRDFKNKQRTILSIIKKEK